MPIGDPPTTYPWTTYVYPTYAWPPKSPEVVQMEKIVGLLEQVVDLLTPKDSEDAPETLNEWPENLDSLGPCPSCGRHKIQYLRLTDDKGNFQHSHYICKAWVPNDDRPYGTWCGWSGWTVPDA